MKDKIKFKTKKMPVRKNTPSNALTRIFVDKKKEAKKRGFKDDE